MNSHLKSYICLLEVDYQDLIIINIPSFLDLFKRMKSPVLIDISEPGAPKLIDTINTNIILEACGNLMVAVFRELSVKLNSMNLCVNFPDHFYPSLLTQSESTDVVKLLAIPDYQKTISCLSVIVRHQKHRAILLLQVSLRYQIIIHKLRTLLHLASINPVI